MSRLAASVDWYKAEKKKLEAIDEWVRAGMQVSNEVKPFVLPFVSNVGDQNARKKVALDRLRAASQELDRMALLRVYASFESDFRAALLKMLHRACGRLRSPANERPLPSDKDLKDAVKHLPNMISCMPFASGLEPRLSSSDRNAVEKLRGFRNEVMHGGFLEKPTDEVEEAATLCTRVIDIFAETHDHTPAAAPATPRV